MGLLADTATAALDAVRSGRPLDPSVCDRLLSATRAGLPDDQIEALVRTLQPAIRGCDWPGYLIREGLPLDGLTDHEREDLEAARHPAPEVPSTAAGSDPASREWEERVAGHEGWAAAESPLVERLEALAGADTRAVQQIAEAVGEPNAAFLTLPPWPQDQLPTRLRSELPIAVPVTDHETTKFLHELLKAIGVRGRRVSPVVILCGRELGILFPAEADTQSGTYAFRQARLLIEHRRAASPDDVEAVAWLAELSLRAEDTEAGAALARRLWELTESHNPTSLARIVQFSLSHQWDYSEPRFDGRSWDAGRLGRLESGWYDRDEPLAYALLRRAFGEDRWNADLVQTVFELRCNGLGEQHELDDDLMPSAGWVWAAHTDGRAGYHYYRAWNHAFAAAVARHERDTTILAVPHLIVGALRGRCDPAYQEWLGALLSHATTPGERRAAAQVVAGLANVAGNLPPPARLTLARLANEFATEMEPVENSAAEASALIAGLADVAGQEEQARTHLGDRLWERLSDQTRCHVRQTLGVFHYFRLTPGDTVGYGIVFVELANAILSEVDVQFSTALRLRSSVFRDRDIRDALCPPGVRNSPYSRSLGSVPYLFRLFDSPAHRPAIRRYAAALRADGIRIDTLVRLTPDIEDLVGARNPGAHAGDRIDREQAAVLYNRWFGEGVLRELFGAMHPYGMMRPPPRVTPSGSSS